MLKLFYAVPLLVLLAACTAPQAAVVNLATEKIKVTNDTAAQTLIVTVCGMTVGAYNRLESASDRQGVDLLCGGDGEDPITLQDLRRFVEAQ
jgi:hypothetical protein